MELLEFVWKVKKALALEEIKSCYVGFNDFPAGACMDSSILLGILLNKNGYGIFNLVSGWSNTEHFFTHTWLESENHIIDITADQFNACRSQLPVLNLVDTPNFYSSFDIQFKESVLGYTSVPDLGFFKALTLVDNELLK